MTQDDSPLQDKTNGKKLGRPTVMQRNGDPAIAYEAKRLRDIGLSWSKIADQLDISRTTARRLCQKSNEVCQKGEEGERGGELREEGAVENTGAEDDYLAIDEIYEHMPKSYQRFVRLMREARGLD